MSYSLGAIYDSASWAISNHTLALSILQEQAASGQAINRPSDNPTDADRILDLKSDSRSMARYIETLTEVIDVMDLSGSTIQQMSGDGGLSGALASLTSALSSLNTDDMIRQQKAGELDGILEEMVSLANKQRMGHRLFSGASSDVDPYTVTRNSSGEITQVTYQGSHEERQVTVAPGVEMSAVLVGDNLFRYDDPSAAVFYGDTGAAAGTASSSVRGDVTLTVTGSAGNYDLSSDGGATTVNVDGSESNVAVINSLTGEVLYVDATAITQVGSDHVRSPGTYDIFNILISARDLLNNASSMASGQWNDIMSATIDSMKIAEQKLVRAFPTVGGRLSTLQSLKTSMEDMKLGTDENVSRKQDADITQVAIDLARHEILYQMSLSVAAKMFSMSLMDFIS
ncbi:MAG: flagellar hook-associated protein FlgL [Planctomycetes bacterium]|nr:flagellar hook-associated protein FlgL [Planctomycetota bacterium]